MPDRTTAGTHYELTAKDGTTKIPFMLAPGPNGFPTIQEAIAAAEVDAPIVEALRPTVYESFLGGIGISYNVAPGVYTRSDGYAISAGAMTSVQVPNGTGFTTSPIVAFAEFGGDLFCIQRGAGATYGGRVLRLAGGTGSAWTTVTMSSYGGSPSYITAGEFMRDLFLFDDGAGVQYIYATSSDANGLNGRLHRSSNGTTWTSTAAGTFGTYGRNRSRPVNWSNGEGIGWRIETIDYRNSVSYTLPATDPFLGPSWVERVYIKTGYALTDLAGADTHIWHGAMDGLFDLNEQGESPNLVSREAFPLHPQNATALMYFDGWVYITNGHGGLHRIRVENRGEKTERQSIVRPGWGTRAESEWLAGYTTALAVSDALINAQYNPTTQKSAVFFGVDRERANIDSPSPMIWYGPEFTIGADYKITRMYPTGLALDNRLWMAAQSAGGTPITAWGSLPDAGAPIDDLISGGQMRFNSHDSSGIYNAPSYIEFLPDGMGDRSSLKILNDVTYTTRGLSQQVSSTGSVTNDGLGTKLVAYTRAVDALAPSSTAWGTGADVTQGPTQAIVPTDTKQGYLLQHRIEFVNPQGTASPPKVGVLDACRPTQWAVVPNAEVRALTIRYGDGVAMLDGTPFNNLSWTPNSITDLILELTRAGRTVIRDPYDNRRTVKIFQGFDREVEVRNQGGDEYGKRVTGRLRFTDLGTAS